jgi:hypothetical protein
MNLVEMVTRAREDLKDTDSQNYIWQDGEIQSAVLRAVDEYSLQAPMQHQDDIATTDGATEIDITPLENLLQVDSVEFPLGQNPKHMQHIEYWAGRLYMEDEGDGTDARVRWLAKHTIDGEETTIPLEHQEIIVLGATAYLAMAASAYTVDRATIAGQRGTISYKEWGTERFKRYDQKLKQVAQGNRVTRRTLYTQDD